MDITKFLSKITSSQTFVILILAIILPLISSFTMNYWSNTTGEEILKETKKTNVALTTLMNSNINHVDYRGALFIVEKTTNYSKNAILRALMTILVENHINDPVRQDVIKSSLKRKIRNLYESDVNRLNMFSYEGMRLNVCLQNIDPDNVSSTLGYMIENQCDNKTQLRRDLLNYLDLLFDQILRNSDKILLKNQEG